MEHARGHNHLYGDFDDVLGDLMRYQKAGGVMTENLAREALATIDLLLQENIAGRRPGTGNWETYFGKCMDDAHRLVHGLALFPGFATFLPRGYCNRFLDAFAYMDHQDREYEDRHPRRSMHFAGLAMLAAEMFSLLADSAASVKDDFLDHPDDKVFTWLLSGYAKSEAPEAVELVNGYLADDEPWVQRLAERLLQERAKAQQSRVADRGQSMAHKLIISCHADTGFRLHRLSRTPDGLISGHLDNFAGVHAVMNAFFSGRMDSDSVRIELTYGEETDMEGAYEVLKSLSPDDVVVVVDVTGTETDKDISIEKCASAKMREFVRAALDGMSYALYEGCPDPIADEDECDVYREKLENVFFLGIPCTGGDYNSGIVSCRQASIVAASEAIVRFTTAFKRLSR